MTNLQEILTEVLEAVKPLGLINITPIILNDAGNLIVHLAPYQIIARIAKVLPGNDSASCGNRLALELKAAQHLYSHGIPVVSCSSLVHPGPYKASDNWMTLWEYISPYSLPAPSGEEVIEMINKLSEAMADFKEPLPILGVWETVSKATDSLEAFSEKDQRLAALLPKFKLVDEKVRSMETLYPAHGDAHPRNLIASSTGWRWNDFEDISLMPRFWDLASFMGNTALFHGLKHPVVDYVLTRHIAAKDKVSFLFALKARALMSTISNLSMALGGNGDLDFAYSQLERINDFLSLIDKEILAVL